LDKADIFLIIEMSKLLTNYNRIYKDKFIL